MQVYAAPLRDMRFVLHELHGLQALAGIPRFADLSPELCDSVLDAAADLVREKLLAVNASGDAEGCRLENGRVHTPRGFREAYDAFRDGGWTALAGDPDWGGQGLPESLGFLVEEMVCATNLSFSLYPGLTHGATRALQAHAADWLQALYLPPMVAGRWSGTMCLTEAQCGSDLGLLRSRAAPRADGSHGITGEKIFITSGDHDLTENIVHLVLARLPDAPAGIKGVSMFLVPKLLPDADGRPGRRNGVVCTRLEHKLGLRASATCALSFDDATGWLVGAPHRGMQAMFTMMNAERLAVGMQGLGVAEAAYQAAVAYARERRQGRAHPAPRDPGEAADRIIVHPDVRRMLMLMRTAAEGCRALSGWVAQALDLSGHAADPVARQQAADLCALLTPVVKSLFTELGFESASLAVQVFGGHGYIVEHGVEQYLRDARIAMLYEGTNGIQALDLVLRKLPQPGVLDSFLGPARAFVAAHRDDPELGAYVRPLRPALAALAEASDAIAAGDRESAAAAAADYLQLLGLAALGFMWARAAQVALRRAPDAPADERRFYAAKLATARFFMERVLPRFAALSLAIKSGKTATMQLDEADF